MSESTTVSETLSVPHEKAIHVLRVVTIDRPEDVSYQFWHNPANLNAIFNDVDSVEADGVKHGHWNLKLTGHQTIENEVISRRSLAGSDFQNAGSVRFKVVPPSCATEMHPTLEYVLVGSKNPNTWRMRSGYPLRIVNDPSQSVPTTEPPAPLKFY